MPSSCHLWRVLSSYLKVLYLERGSEKSQTNSPPGGMVQLGLFLQLRLCSLRRRSRSLVVPTLRMKLPSLSIQWPTYKNSLGRFVVCFPLFLEGTDRGYPPLSLLAFRFALLHKRQLESFTAYHKGNLSFLVRDGKVRNIKVTVVFHELRKLRNNAPLSCVRLAFSLGKLVRRGRFPRSCMGILLCGFQLIRRQVIFRFFACFYRLIIGENVLRFFLVWKHSLDTLKAFSVCHSLGDNNHFLSVGGERVLPLSPMGLR